LTSDPRSQRAMIVLDVKNRAAADPLELLDQIVEVAKTSGAQRDP